MIVGVGIDIAGVDRLAEKISRDEFLKKVFSPHEIEFCESKGPDKALHYAGRFCAKEAFLKATGMGMLLTHELHEIEVHIANGSKPEIHLLGEPGKLAARKKWSIHVSLSHIQSSACAIVVIEIK